MKLPVEDGRVGQGGPMTTPTFSIGTLQPPAPSATIRLTERGRRAALFALLIGFVLTLAIGVVGPGIAAPGSTGPASAVPAADAIGQQLAREGLAVSHTVVAGDTLWALATALDPAGDPRPMVDQIQAINGRSSTLLAVGDRIWLPVAKG